MVGLEQEQKVNRAVGLRSHGVVVFFWLLGSVSCGGGDHQATSAEERVRVPRAMLSDVFKAATGFYPDHGGDETYAYGFVGRHARRNLDAPWSNLVEDAAELPITKEMYEGYHDYGALTAELQSLENRYPDLMRLESAGQSVQGRELWYVVMTDRPRDEEGEPKFIYHANMHGDEVVGRELMIYLIRHLAENYGKDARITQILSNVELFIMPSMNPDGFERGTRANAHGYDLNRNFPDRFTSNQDSPAGRQIEVQHMIRLAHEHHFVYGINWHGGEICFNLPWGNISNGNPANKFGDDAMFHPIGREYTLLNRSMYANHRASFDHGLTYGYEWYPVNGGINDWFNHFRRSIHSVVELTVTKWPSASTLARHWEDNREAMLTYLWRGLRGVHLEIRSVQGDLVRNPLIKVASSRRDLLYDTGRVHRLTGDGEQIVTIEAEGMAPKTVHVLADYLNGSYTSVVLETMP